MKILHVNKFFDLRGGAEFYLHDLMARQRKLGHEVHVFSTQTEKNLPSADEEYFVTRYNYDRSEGARRDVKKAISFLWNNEAKRSFSRMLVDIKPDVIHLHNIYHHLSTSILVEVRQSGIPCVQTLHDYKLACPNYKMFTEGKACERCKGGHYCQAIRHNCLNGFWPSSLAALEMASTKFKQSYERTVGAFICPSAFMKNKMIEWGEPSGKMVYVPNPVEIPERVSSDRGTASYVYVGRLSHEKGLETAIRAFARVPSAKLEIIGQGPEALQLQRLAQELAPERIKFLGFLGGTALADYRDKARAFIMPTVMYENSSLAVLEAMAAGVPIIASDIGGIPEMVKDGVNGFLAKPGDVESWIEAINQMESFSSEQRLEMGDAGRELAKNNHNWEKHLKQLDEIYLG
ncbi:MAG: glycosyltransferase family 4 protein [Patescibacteria group bacterium]|nr:glycosyltransferase family 4 protein [Patescibacteria group bacterium]